MLNQILKLWRDTSINYGIRIFIAFIGIVLPCWYMGTTEAITPLILGVIACALTETDEGFLSRLKALFITFICFAVASFSIEILFPYPWLFAIGLFSSTFGFIMLGALGPRYATIAFGSILIAVYAMLGAHTSTNIWQQPALLLLGAAWYASIAMLWHSFWPMQGISQNLSKVFSNIYAYMSAKSELFHPRENLTPQPYRILEAKLNANTVTSLEAVKVGLEARSKRGVVTGRGDRYLQAYFLAQDIHERVSSSHYRYQDLAAHFQDSDVLFRFKYVMQAQANACREIAKAFEQGKVYQQNDTSIIAIDELQLSMQRLKQKQDPNLKFAITQLDYLFDNLTNVERLLANITHIGQGAGQSWYTQEPSTNSITPEEEAKDHQLPDNSLAGLKDMWRRIMSQMTPDSVLFRHALRLSSTLTLGYALIQLLDLDFGFWILLTTLFVCQPNFSATRQKLKQRVIGTISGLLIGFVLLTLFPSQDSQLVFLTISGVLFFSFRQKNYGYATAFITMLVLFCFNQLGEGFVVILPRLFDTLLGCLLAVLAVRYILPDWQSRRLPQVMHDAICANQNYLGHVIAQYRHGKRDSMDYRIARRQAHNLNAALSTGISHMLYEPGKYQHAIDESFRFLTLNHAMLSYISALGAHRQNINDAQIHELILKAHREIHAQLALLSQKLTTMPAQADSQGDDALMQTNDALAQSLALWRDHQNPVARLVIQQLYLVYQMLPEMQQLAEQILAPQKKPNKD